MATAGNRPSEATIAGLFDEHRRTGSRRIRNQLVEIHMGFGVHVARKYTNRGVPDDDLRQVAMMALVKAVDRFDPDRGVTFSTFAGRTVEGEIKRYFRDSTWAVRVPRPAKELHLRIRSAAEDLSHDLGRSPTPRELAAYLSVSTDDVVMALGAGAAYSTDRIEPPSDDNSMPDGRGVLAEQESGFGLTEDRVLLQRLMVRLPEREQEIVKLRFFDELTQAEIADRVGISQMHVSRLLRKSFGQMRQAADDERSAGDPAPSVRSRPPE